MVPELIINPDHYRLGKVVSRIIKALLYVEKGYTEGLKESYTTGWSWEAFKVNSAAKAWKQSVVDRLGAVGVKSVSGVLEYKAKFADPPAEAYDELPLGMWLLRFYGGVFYFGMSGKKTVDNKLGVFCNKYQR